MNVGQSLHLNKDSYTYSLPDKSGTFALSSDIPNNIYCAPSSYKKLVGVTTISSGFNIYRDLSLNLSYGVLYCFCSNTITPGVGTKYTAAAIGFRISEVDPTSGDGEVYAIMAVSNFNLGGYFAYPISLSINN